MSEVSVWVEDGQALIIPGMDDLGRVAGILLAVADSPMQVQAVTAPSYGFVVPAHVFERTSLGSLMGEQGREAPDAPSAPAADHFEPRFTREQPADDAEPRGNASAAVWRSFLAQKGIEVAEDATRDEMREAWKTHLSQ